MTKSIDTLVEDIYAMYTDPDKKPTIKEEDLSTFLQAVGAAVVSSFSTREQKNSIRMSGLGKPNRQVWYDIKGTERLPLSGPTHIKFLYGDILEHLLVLLTKLSGHEVSGQQTEYTIDDIKGHTDGFVDGNLVDFKSASPHGFQKFKNGSLVNDDPFGYIAQISAYAVAAGMPEVAFIAIDKSSGELAVCKVHSMDLINPKNRIKELKDVISKDTPPERCYDAVPDGKSGNMRLGTSCSYCDFRVSCWSDANGGKGLRTFNYSTGPRYLTHVEKEPEVEEVLWR